MLNVFTRLKQCLLLPLLVLCLSLFSQSAKAAETWLPNNFDAGTHVYLDPALANHRQFPVSLAGVEQKLKDAGKAQGFQFYLVMVQQGTEPNGSTRGQKFGAWKLDQFASSVASKLNHDDYVIVLVVRSADDPLKFSLAAQGGNRIQKYGMGPNWMNATNGPLNANRPTYLPNDPGGYALAIANDVNNGAASYEAAIKQREADAKAAAERERERQIAEAERAKQEAIDAQRRAEENAAFRAALPGKIIAWGTPLSVLLTFVIAFALTGSRRKRLQAAIADWENKFNNSNTNYLQLREAYFGFLQSNGTDWSKKFTGTTLATYTAAVKKYADLSARIQVAQNMLDQARRSVKVTLLSPLLGVKVTGPMLVGFGGACLLFAVNWQWAVLLGGFSIIAGLAYSAYLSLKAQNEGNDLLTKNPVTVTGNELPIEERSFFGSIMEETKYEQPAALLDDMAQLFSNTNKALASIKAGFDGARKNRDDIDGLTKKIEEGKSRLQAAALNFDPYEKTFGEIKADTDKFLQILTSDPMSAFEQSEEVEKVAEALLQKIDAAIKAKESLAATEKVIRTAEARTAEVRAQNADYSYP
ncbi:MAG: hypothetical protein K2X27_08630, partial [Candidatus Obscuribacterales bacterium]|nr:hypothetical protein [Candidatus Obscuribacterales bacterium]